MLGFGPTSKYNLSSSGLSEPDLEAMGVDTRFEDFAAEKEEHLRMFTEELARLYRVEPENVVVTSGGTEAIFLAYSVLGAGGKALVPLPNYGPMFTVPRALGMKLEHVLDVAPSDKRVVCGLTDPNNPTGLRLDEEALETLSTAKSRDRVVFVNETYREFTFPSRPQTHFDGSRNVVTCGTMTKFFGLGRLRVGWVMADKATAKKLGYAKWAVSGHDSEYSLWLASQVLRKRERFAKRARRIFTRNSKLVREFADATDVVSLNLGSAPFCLVRYAKGPNSVDLADSIRKKTGVLVAPGDFFGAAKSFRLCFTSEDDTLAKGLDELSRFLRENLK